MSSIDKLRPKGPNARKAYILALAIMFVYLLMSTRSTLWDRDEPRLARTAVEMTESGNYLSPTFNYEMNSDKPPFLFWVMAIGIRLFGAGEFGCRFFGVVGTVLTCLLTYYIGRDLIGPKGALWAMMILASSMMMLIVGASVTTDAVLMPFIIAAMLVFFHGLVGGRLRIWHSLLIGICFGVGALAKGPIGLLPLPAMAFALWFCRKQRPAFWIEAGLLCLSVVIGGLMFAAWAVPANRAADGELMKAFLWRDVISRAIKPREHHGGNFLVYLPYYIPVVIVGFFPWVLFLPGAICALWGRRVGGKYGRVFLLSWILSTFILMSLAATKLPHYVIFIWPGLALAVAGVLVAAEQGKLVDWDKRWLRGGVWFFGPMAIAMALGLMIGPWFVGIPGLRWSGTAAGIILLVTAVTAILHQLENRPRVCAAIVLTGMMIFQIPVLFGIVPAIEQVKLPPTIAQAVTTKTPPDAEVVCYEFDEPTLHFYIGRHIEKFGSAAEVAAWSKQEGAGVLIIPVNDLVEIEKSYGQLPLEMIASKQGINYSKGDVLELGAFVR